MKKEILKRQGNVSHSPMPEFPSCDLVQSESGGEKTFRVTEHQTTQSRER